MSGRVGLDADVSNVIGSYLDLDRMVFEHPGGAEKARAKLDALIARVGPCSDRTVAERAECVVTTLLRHSNLRTGSNVVSATGNSISGVVDGTLGSCAAMTAIVLLAGSTVPEAQLEAVVFEDHVAVAGSREPNVLFELLRRGQREGLDSRRPIARVGVDGFLPYYIDNLGARFVDENRITTAQKLMDIAIEIRPTEPRFLFNRGTLYLQMQEYARAASDLKAALRRRPEMTEAITNLIVVEMKLGRTSEAERWREELRRRQRGNSTSGACQ